MTQEEEEEVIYQGEFSGEDKECSPAEKSRGKDSPTFKKDDESTLLSCLIHLSFFTSCLCSSFRAISGFSIDFGPALKVRDTCKTFREEEEEQLLKRYGKAT